MTTILMKKGSLTRHVLAGTGPVGLILVALLIFAAKAWAEPTDRHDPLGGYPGDYIRPVSLIAQLEHCSDLVEKGESSGVVAKCFQHASRLLDEGLRQRQAAPSANNDFEKQLKAGAKIIAARLRTLSLDDKRRLNQELRDINEEILSLRVRLSRIAASEHVQLSLISRGGISLGNWQAGLLYLVTEWAKQRPGQRREPAISDPAFSTVTGASAGAVNGLVAAVEGCKCQNLVASNSLYYQIWIDLGLFGRHGASGLFPVDQDGSSALGLFANRALEETLNKAEDYVRDSEQLPSCQVDFGFVTTHLDRTESPIHVRQDGTPILTTKKLKEKFSVRLSFSDPPGTVSLPGQPTLKIINIGPSKAYADDQIYYAGLGHTKEVPLPTLLLAVRASGAFPAAFPPVPLTYTQYVPGPNHTVLPRKRVATFIDGGILDNTPLGLAVGLDAWRNAPANPDPYLEGLIPAEPRTYIFLEPEVTSWVRGVEDGTSSSTRERDMLKVFLDFAGDLLVTSMDAQLTNTAEQYPFVRRQSGDWTRPRLSVPERHMPITGARFAHFMAFLERDFRIFDFYVGMADAYVYLRNEQSLYAEEGSSCAGAEDLRLLDAALQEANPLYRCLRAYYDSDEFQVLKPISTTELPLECEFLTESTCLEDGWQVTEEAVEAFLTSRAVLNQGEEEGCIESAITHHNFRTLVAGMHNYKVWTQSDTYSEDLELDRFFDELGKEELTERFIYVDLPTYQHRYDGTLDTNEVKQAFRSLMQEGIESLASEQAGSSKYVLSMGGRAGVDLVYQRDYPERIAGVGIVVNGLEGMYGQRMAKTAWRWDSVLRFFRIKQETYDVGLSPWSGEFYLSTQATRILSPARFADVELGAGWALSETIAFNSASPGHVAFRTGPRALLALVVLQRIYVALNVDYYPIIDMSAAYESAINPAVSDWEWNLSGGWRFLF